MFPINRHTYAYGIWEGIGVCIGVPASSSSSSWVLFANKILQIGRMHVVGPVRDLAGMVPGIGG